jgi:serine/threonine-protein kinase
MSSDRWRSLERLYHAALERPPEEHAAFLRDACDDDALKQEVLSLLEQASMPGFLEAPALEIAAAMVGDVRAPPWVGRRFGVYQVQELLGKGGMGEVYRAHDTRLGRDVAIKVLPQAFTADPERLARFEREARVLASLNHPHIGTIHGVEESEGTRALILELVDGPTLAERLASGPMPLEESVAVARQIADALDAAHEHGIVHRDLKPSNIKMRPDGPVKVLDFGLAKAADLPERPDGPTSSPSITGRAVTQPGLILGTTAYMSPEQAQGHAVDKRADVWAFGCVFYEMLTGTCAFEGEGVTDTMSLILRGEPDWSRLPASVPIPLQQVLRRCLEKDRRRRRRDIADVRQDIDDALTARSEPSLPRTVRRVSGVAALILAVAAVAGTLGWRSRPVAPPVMRRFVVPLGANENFTSEGRHVVAISPDGSALVYVANSRLFLRRLDQLTASAIPGTEAGSGTPVHEPFFSFDGAWIAFFVDGQLKRVPAGGGTPVTLAAMDKPDGASWSKDDTILVGRGSDGIWRLPAAGGTAEQIIKVRKDELAHGPHLLPDGDHVLFTLWPPGASSWDDAGIVVQSIRTGKRTTVIQRGQDARYVESGDLVYVVYVSAGMLSAVRFDVSTQKTGGSAVSLVENVASPQTTSGASQYAVARNGSMAYVPGGQHRSLVWVGRNGVEDRDPVVEGIPDLQNPRLSPDGRSIALVSAGNLWVHDLHGRPAINLTFGGGNFSPVWAANGRQLFYESGNGLMSVPADATGQPEPAARPGPANHFHPHAVTPDGAELIVVHVHDDVASPDNDIVRLTPAPNAEPRPVVVTPNMEGFLGVSLSPNGRWLAYVSQATGQKEIWVQRYPGPGRRFRVSANSGSEPNWSKDGRELYYRQGNLMMAVAVQTGTTFSFLPARALFEHRYADSSQPPSYDVAAGGRFLMVKNSNPQGTAPSIVLTLGWFEELKQRLP